MRNECNESNRHAELKQTIYRICNNIDGCNCNLEKEICNQKTDVFAEYNGKRYGFEVQLSRISYKKLQRRHRQYLDNNVLGIWLIGFGIGTDFNSIFGKFSIPIPYFRLINISWGQVHRYSPTIMSKQGEIIDVYQEYSRGNWLWEYNTTLVAGFGIPNYRLKDFVEMTIQEDFITSYFNTVRENKKRNRTKHEYI